MSYKILAERDVDLYCTPGDHLIVRHTDEKGKATECRHAIKEKINVKRLAILKINNELGFKEGLVGVFGS